MDIITRTQYTVIFVLCMNLKKKQGLSLNHRRMWDPSQSRVSYLWMADEDSNFLKSSGTFILKVLSY